MNKKIQMALALVAVSLGLGACAKSGDEPTPAVVPTAEQEAVQGHVETVSLSATLGLEEPEDEDELKALDGLKFLNSRLLPDITGDKDDKGIVKLKGVIIVANDNHIIFEEKQLDYDVAKRTVSYVGEINLGSITSSTGTKVRLLIAPAGWWNNSTKTLKIPAQNAIKETNQDNDTTLGLKVAYMSEWHKPLDAGWYFRNIKLKPLGHVMRITARDVETDMDFDATGPELVGLELESTVLSKQGTYNLASMKNVSGKPTYQATDTPYNSNDQGIYHLKWSVDATNFQSEQAYYVWVHAIPNVTNKRTRGFLSVKYTPVFNPNYTGWSMLTWLGAGSYMRWGISHEREPKRVVAAYTEKEFTSSGSTMPLRLTDYNALPQISRFTPQVAVNAYEYWAQDANIGFIERYEQVENSALAQVYTMQYMTQVLFAETGGELTLPRGVMPMYAPGHVTQWSVPTRAQLLMLLPGLYSNSDRKTNVMAVADPNFEGIDGSTATQKELLAPQANKSSRYVEKEYDADYLFIKDEYSFAAIRLKGDGDRWKTFYKYNATNVESRNNSHAQGDERTTVEAYYLGPYYPDITSAKQFIDYPGVKPHYEERSYPWLQKYWNYGQGGFVRLRGGWFWTAGTNDKGLADAIMVDHLRGQVTHGYSGSDNNATGAIFMIRDFGDMRNGHQ